MEWRRPLSDLRGGKGPWGGVEPERHPAFAPDSGAGHERAVEIASRIVEALGEPVEIRPIMGADFAA
ncbi:hypothetical protein B005_4810 [Nocardiopsis alba ATCC BAA-2165]|uniref:Uncharacterized protein n=1 Tax=Nocardiopsis alba (strain ATCC BAA-2165 / BE74) TaxID=1205910 RepID=J7KWV7_NOCAA|nr:hypothetical protein B005_4810 [Nocardiopsis alba ATCC BAA-2165]